MKKNIPVYCSRGSGIKKNGNGKVDRLMSYLVANFIQSIKQLILLRQTGEEHETSIHEHL